MRFYLDEHMPRVLEQALLENQHEVIMAIDADMTGKDDDEEHLPYATQNEAVLVTSDHPFAGRAMKHEAHAGVICWTGKQNDFKGMIRALLEFGRTYTQEEVKGLVFWLK